MNLRIGIAVALVGVFTVGAFAQSAVGTWKGKLNLKLDLPKTEDPQMKAMMAQQLKAMKAITINLALKADKTYTLTTTGAPQNMGGNQTDKGTWKQAGKTITVVSTKNSKKPDKPQTMTLSPDGKTLTMTLPGPNGKSSGSIVFKK